jgi:hypothetical protein
LLVPRGLEAAAERDSGSTGTVFAVLRGFLAAGMAFGSRGLKIV